jgi:hypothetical protein
MNEITPEDKLDKVYEFCIRMEPVIQDVKDLKKWKEGNGIPGARFQLWLLWGVFAAVVTKLWTKL